MRTVVAGGARLTACIRDTRASRRPGSGCQGVGTGVGEALGMTDAVADGSGDGVVVARAVGVANGVGVSAGVGVTEGSGDVVGVAIASGLP
jgi:hypothetical protein